MSGYDGWPLTSLADIRLPEQPTLHFVAVIADYRCSVHALEDLVMVGSLRWMADLSVDQDFDAGTIGYVYVPPEHRRRGIATALLRVAEAYAERYGMTAPRHDQDQRSADGEAWAVALGADPASIITIKTEPGA